MKWLLEPGVFQDDLLPFILKLQELGIEHTVCQFGISYEEQLKSLIDDHIFIGSMQFAKAIKATKQWSGLYYNLPKFECSYYYPRFNDYILNDKYVILPFGSLNHKKTWLLNHIAEDNYLFIRPNSGDKSFTGKLITEKNWELALKNCGPICPETLIVIAPPINVFREWRLIIVDGKIVASSQYKEMGKTIRSPNTPLEVIQYATVVLQNTKYTPEKAWVMDICESGLGLNVLEIGTFSCSGFYACDPEPIIRAFFN